MCVCVCVCVADDPRQLGGGGGGGGGGGKWYLVPPPTSPPLCICPLQFEQCGFFLPASFFFFFLFVCPTHWPSQSERASEEVREESGRGGGSATGELIKLMRTAAGTVLCVCVCVCVCVAVGCPVCVNRPSEGSRQPGSDALSLASLNRNFSSFLTDANSTFRV